MLPIMKAGKTAAMRRPHAVIALLRRPTQPGKRPITGQSKPARAWARMKVNPAAKAKDQSVLTGGKLA
ncbi:hypothetical protein NCCP1664_15850 [Zafaria cholistanensis]|uniref:Uncharacterized protein n=1 Tax=Zafaria cholistanensis TaxID=1682741 RepID=A0A5A7NQV2_9MICC|nr:hypothetical protein NCCP1664_15850 [Zafaria cholistanensis]